MLPITRVRAVPWIVVFELAMTARKHWQRLDAKDRARLAELLKKSQGRPNRLSAKERAAIRELVAKLEPRAFARSVVPIGRKAVKARRR
jgi:mRNA-degrading endonuclease RelE of RelBE toxin-antitoxin system